MCAQVKAVYREKARGRALCEHPRAVHILHIRDCPAAKHDDDIALRRLGHGIRPLKLPHQAIRYGSDGEEIEHSGKRTEQHSRTGLMPSLP